MAQISEGSACEEDDGLDSPTTYRRGRKRRRLNDANTSDSEDVLTSSATLSQKNPASPGQSKGSPEEAIEKPKSKYKIHNPKNPDLPKDVFFTQPPDRSSSPYRIDQFNWQKRNDPGPAAVRSPSVKKLAKFPDSANSSTNRGYEIRKFSANAQLQPQEPNEDYGLDEDYEELLADLPPDAFSSPETVTAKTQNETILISSQQDRSVLPQKLAAPLTNLKQVTLFGTQAQVVPSQTQSKRKSNWPMANREEPATHHAISRDAMNTWVYPTNLETIRDYQYSIVARALYHNMLVALPTGLGKTLIAAIVMLNWFRWTTSAQIVFVAPTKPLVSQQVKACFEIAGIPRSCTTILTGSTTPGLRAEEWQSKRVFFMTPQTLINDLKTGICDPKRVVLIVVDEAHRATGGYAYVEVVSFVKRFNTSFRVLALTATPGATIESVQEVIDGLGISRVEIRTEESLDIRQYVHPRNIETVLFDNSDEMTMIMDLFSEALQPVIDKLTGVNAYWSRNPMNLTPYGCLQARQRWYASDAGRKAAGSLKGMVMSIFGLLGSLSHAIELLKFHGIGPFFHKIKSFGNKVHANGNKGDKYSRQITASQSYQTMMFRMQSWINNSGFVGHPKLEYLQSVVMNHFLDAGEGRGESDPSSTRIMVFSHYRDSAEEIARVLKRNEPMIRPSVFVGQSSTKNSEGMDQKTQLNIIKKFQSGTYNTLVATSIGEEGLDIGEVDLIVCYDASASPIRMLQRMGRTGRKRSGNIVVTLMKGKEETNFTKAKDNYEKMQQEIASGARFNFHDDESRRIVPKDIQPVVDKCIVEIPLENTQADLPEPKKRGRPPKRPPKKFHMPDGVRTGFTKASLLHGDPETEDEGNAQTDRDMRDHQAQKSFHPRSPEPVPPLEQVLLTAAEEAAFERKYLDIKGDTSQTVEAPQFNAFPKMQRRLRPTRFIGHSKVTERVVKALGAMQSMTMEKASNYEKLLHRENEAEGQAQAKKRADFLRHRGRELVEEDEANAISSSDGRDDDDQEVDAASSKSSPPPPSVLGSSDHQPRFDVTKHGSESDEDLPDIGKIVRGSAHVGTIRARGGRRILTEDSDDD